jgi:hypothetical protein
MREKWVANLGHHLNEYSFFLLIGRSFSLDPCRFRGRNNETWGTTEQEIWRCGGEAGAVLESKRGRRVVVIFRARYPRGATVPVRASSLEVTILGKIQTWFPFPAQVLGRTNRHRMPTSHVHILKLMVNSLRKVIF